MDMKTHIGLKVKSARQQKGLTQEELADAIGKATETVSNIERGHALTGLDTLQRIARVVDVPMTHFFEGIDENRNVSRVRLEREERLFALVKGLSDEDLSLSTALIETMVRQKSADPSV